ncbi:putative UDP-glucose 4-epimerase [Tricladium varicosporioides]|nr:putative UDP-glucose 4-epimerase [Hymenoscyphus varicosporioides]
MVIQRDTPSSSSSSEHSPSRPHSRTASEISTPATERSILFGSSFNNLFFRNDQCIAVIGGLGYIGSHTCLELIKAGYNIIIIDNLSNSFLGVFDRLKMLAKRHYQNTCAEAPFMRFYEADFRDEVSIRQILNTYTIPPAQYSDGEDATIIKTSIMGIIHFAAYKSVSESIQEPLKYYSNNVAGLIEFCSVVQSFHINTIIYSSSATVYGSIANDGIPLLEEYCTHQTETFLDHDGKLRTVQGGCTGLTNPYGRSKWMCEAILSDLALANPGLTIIALRYFNPVGCDESGLLAEDPRGVPTNLIPIVVKVLTGESPALDVYGTDYPTQDGTAVRDFIHVTDLARGHIAALVAASDGRVPNGFRTYNLGTGTGQSVLDVVEALEAASSSKIPIRNLNRRLGDVGVCVAMPRRAEEELEWKTEKSLRTSCRDICHHLEIKRTDTGQADSPQR